MIDYVIHSIRYFELISIFHHGPRWNDNTKLCEKIEDGDEWAQDTI